MKKKNKSTFLKIFRTFVQLIFFVLLPGLYSNAFLGIRLIYQGLIAHNFNFSKSFPELVSAISIIPITLLFGRFFCGWMCAFGTLGDLLYSVSRRAFKIKFKINKKADSILKYIKYVIFLFLFIAVWTVPLINVYSLSPWDAFGSLLSFNRIPDFSFAITQVTIGFILLIAIMVGSLFIERFFCRYFCPLGAVFSIISHLKIVRIRKPSKDCGSCRACTRKCSMGIPLSQMDTVNSGECINCLECITVCPRDNAKLSIPVSNPALAGAVAVSAIAGVYYIGSFTSENLTAFGGELPTISSSSVTSATYQDGVYEGSGIGFRNATTTVWVTVSGGMITNIKPVSYGDDRPYFDTAFQLIASQIISEQSPDVDAVSGATFSSFGIMDAVTNALVIAKQSTEDNSTFAGSETDDSAALSEAPSSTPTPDSPSTSPTDVPSVAATNTPTAAPASPKTSSSTASKSSATKSSSTVKSSSSTTKKNSSGSTGSATSSKTPTVTAKPTSIPTIVPKATKALTVTASKYKDGVYQGSAVGYKRGVTTVQVTIKSDNITDIEIISSGDTPRFFNHASSTIISEILDAQSTNVDAVSGATYSSLGIMNAVADALSQAEA